MSNLKELTAIEAQTVVVAMIDLEEVRAAATEFGIKFSGNSGIASLKSKIVDFLEPANQDAPDVDDSANRDLDDEPIQVAKIKPKATELSDHDLIAMDPTKIEDVQLRRRAVRARALRMLRVKINNLDPQDAPLNGGIITVSNKYTGKVSKYIPYGEESQNGYYVPKIILDHMAQMQFAFRKEKKGNRFGVKQYQTVMTKKFNIEYLDHLTSGQLTELAAQQRAAGSIDSPTATT